MNNLKTFKRNKPSKDINDYRFTFYGGAGVGKTTTAFNFFDDPIFFAWEQGQKTLDAFIWDCYSWKDLLDFIKQAKKLFKEDENNELKNKVIIMDTVDIMRNACESYICEMNGWESPGDAPYGQGWTSITKEFEDRVNELESLGFRVNYIAHDKTKTTTLKDGTEYDKVTLFLGSAAVSPVIKKIDVIMHFDYEYSKDSEGNIQKERIIRFNGGENYESKSRIQGLPDVVHCKDTPEATAKMLQKMFADALNGIEIKDHKDEEKPTKKENNTVSQEEIEQLSDLAMTLYKEEGVQASEIAEIVKSKTSVDKIEEIKDRGEFEEVQKALQNL